MVVYPAPGLSNQARMFYGGNARSRFITLQKVFNKFPFMLDGNLIVNC